MVDTKQKTALLNVAQEGSLWWGVTIVLTLVWLSFLGIFGLVRQNLSAGFVVIIFGFMITVTLILIMYSFLFFYSSYKSSVRNPDKFYDNNWRIPSLAFIIGLIIQLIILSISNARGTFSLFSVQRNALFSTFASQLPQLNDFVIQSFMVPVVEELFFLFFIPQIMFLLFSGIGKKFTIFSNKILQFIIIIGLVSYLFAVFHIGREGDPLFFWSAIIFRAILIIVFWGDKFFNIIPFLPIAASFAVGIHIGNNWGTYGFLNGLGFLFSGGIGWIILIWLFLQIISSIDLIFDKIKSLIGG